MKTTIKTLHEESFTKNDDIKQYIGVIINLDKDGEKINSFPYSLRLTEDPTYVIYDTIMDLLDHLFYGDNSDKVLRYYIKEDDFDNLYDNGINGTFEEYLKEKHW